MPLSTIKQTSRLLLIDEFTNGDGAITLDTLLRNEEDKSELFIAIKKNLEVTSFKEFVEKFTPTIWEWFEGNFETDDNGEIINDGEGKPKLADPDNPILFRYSLEKPKNADAHPLEITKHGFYNLVMKLYEKQSKSGNNIYDFDYADLEKFLSPMSVYDDARSLRKDLNYNCQKLLEAGEGAKEDRKKAIVKIKNIRRQIVAQYKDNFTGVLKLSLADAETRYAKLMQAEADQAKLLSASKKSTEVKALPGEEVKQLEAGKNAANNALMKTDTGSLQVVEEKPAQSKMLSVCYNIDTNGDLVVVPVESGTGNEISIPDNAASLKAQELVAYDFDNSVTGSLSTYIKNIVLETYTPATGLVTLDNKADIIKKKRVYSYLYKNSQEALIRAICSAVEKMLAVKVFFDEAAGIGKLQAPVIVANCKVNALTANDTRAAFEKFIEEVAIEKSDFNIWFAVIPAIGDPDLLDDVMDEDEDLYDLNDIRSVQTKGAEKLISLNDAVEAINILTNGKIVTFFNFRANEQTGFIKLKGELIDSYMEKLDALIGNDYAVFAYPNFTIVPKKATTVKIGSDEKDNATYLDIPGVYIDAAYVAAGLVVASQNPSMLKKLFGAKAVNSNYPGVRIDLEDEYIQKKLISTMKCELLGQWDSSVDKAIEDTKFGFLFCGNESSIKESGLVKKIINSYVLQARTMGKKEDGSFKELFRILSKKLINQLLTFGKSGNKIPRKAVKKFINNEVYTWNNDFSDDKQIYVNNILHSKDTIFLDEDNILHVGLMNDNENIDLEIVEEEE